MKRKWLLWAAIAVVVLCLSLGTAYARSVLHSRPGFQVSTLGALNVGIYQGAATITELKRQGNFGLGTFEGLDGEMVVLDGRVYQINADGVASVVTDKIKTPFAAVTFFKKERSIRLPGQLSYQDLQQALSQRLPSQNLPYALRMEGIFPYLKVRSVPRQTLPYPPLSTVISQQQTIFELRNVRGTLVGFWLPSYLKEVNVAGFHFHFITSDRKTGGHVLDGTFSAPVADLATLYDWDISLPENAAFAKATLE